MCVHVDSWHSYVKDSSWYFASPDCYLSLVYAAVQKFGVSIFLKELFTLQFILFTY